MFKYLYTQYRSLYIKVDYNYNLLLYIYIDRYI